MATITITRLNNLLSKKLGDELAEDLTTYISESIKEQVKDETSEAATRDFVKSEINAVRSEISASKTDMIKWFVGLFMILAAMIIGLYFRK